MRAGGLAYHGHTASGHTTPPPNPSPTHPPTHPPHLTLPVGHIPGVALHARLLQRVLLRQVHARGAQLAVAPVCLVCQQRGWGRGGGCLERGRAHAGPPEVPSQPTNQSINQPGNQSASQPANPPNHHPSPIKQLHLEGHDHSRAGVHPSHHVHQVRQRHGKRACPTPKVKHLHLRLHIPPAPQLLGVGWGGGGGVWV